MRRLTRPLLILLAIVFLIEAWLWSHLEPIVEWIVARIPLRAVKAWIAGTVRKLPPAATLIVFIVPVAMLFPFKLLGLWLLAHKQWIAASIVLVLAKLVGVAVTAFVFEVTQAQAAEARPGSAGSMSTCWRGSTGRTTWSPRSSGGSRGCSASSGRNEPGRALRLLWRIRRRMRAAHGAPRAALRANAPRAARTAQSP